MYSVPVLKAAPGLRVRCRTSRSPTTGTSGRPDSRATASTLVPRSTAYAASATPANSAVRRARERWGRGGWGWVASLSDVPRAACMSGTVWHAGNAMSRILPMGFPQDSQTP